MAPTRPQSATEQRIPTGSAANSGPVRFRRQRGCPRSRAQRRAASAKDAGFCRAPCAPPKPCTALHLDRRCLNLNSQGRERKWLKKGGVQNSACAIPPPRSDGTGSTGRRGDPNVHRCQRLSTLTPNGLPTQPRCYDTCAATCPAPTFI